MPNIEELLAIRKTIIVAIASDDELVERLVLKGGNALDIIYKVGQRSSLDIDFSMADDFEDAEEMEDIRRRIFRALSDRFDSHGYIVFDERLERRPRNRDAEFAVWGGYNAKFKLISKVQYRDLGGVLGIAPSEDILESLRRQAQEIGPGHQRTFEIEISKFEYIEGRVLCPIESYDCYVYTPAMIAAEKLRAICQQLPAYTKRKNPCPRPRDFFDIHTVYEHAGCDLTLDEHLQLIIAMFAVKEVPLSLLADIGTEATRAFHEQAWPSVENAVRGGPLQPFNYYFDFVVREADRVHSKIDR